MVITNEVILPEESELTVDEIPLSTATLMAAAPFIGKACEGVNSEFMLCRQESNDPRPCIALGKSVTACAMEVFKCRIKPNCADEFKQYANCIDKSSTSYRSPPCRTTQKIFNDCMKDKAGLADPGLGYFCRARVHTTSLAKPPLRPCPSCMPKTEMESPSLPDSHPRKPARFNSRNYWVHE